MHMQGTPQTMQLDPQYDDVVRRGRATTSKCGCRTCGGWYSRGARGAGPGHRLRQAAASTTWSCWRISTALGSLGRPVCLGVSRKGFINRILGRAGRMPSTATSAACGVMLHAVSRGWAQVPRPRRRGARTTRSGSSWRLDEARAG